MNAITISTLTPQPILSTNTLAEHNARNWPAEAQAALLAETAEVRCQSRYDATVRHAHDIACYLDAPDLWLWVVLIDAVQPRQRLIELGHASWAAIDAPAYRKVSYPLLRDQVVAAAMTDGSVEPEVWVSEGCLYLRGLEDAKSFDPEPTLRLEIAELRGKVSDGDKMHTAVKELLRLLMLSATGVKVRGVRAVGDAEVFAGLYGAWCN